VSDPTPPVWSASTPGGPEPQPATEPTTPGAMSLPVAVPTEPVTPVVRPSKSGKVSGGMVAVALSALIAVGGLAFAIGRVTAPAATTGATDGRFGNGNFQPGTGTGQVPGDGLRFNAGGITLSGTVTKVTDTELTIKTSSGNEVTIPIDDSTAYHSQTAASSADVDDGTKVQVLVEGGRIGQGAAASPGAASPGAASPGLVSPGAGVPGAGSFGTATDVTIVGD
jgi:preprotein translocase subunit YajC